jgi:hypothetical protein
MKIMMVNSVKGFLGTTSTDEPSVILSRCTSLSGSNNQLSKFERLRMLEILSIQSLQANSGI